jgi:uroporphyrinogen-III synthase
VKPKRVVVTRAAHQARELALLLEERGALPLLYPAIGIIPPKNFAPLEDGILRVARGEFDWMVATSVNTVIALSDCLDSLGIARDSMGRAKIAAVGRATADAARTMLRVRVDVVPKRHDARHLAEAMAPASGTRVFLPQSQAAGPSLAEELSRGGAGVLAVEAYRTTVGTGGVDLPRLLERGEIDAITFTSAATVENFMKRLDAEGGDASRLRDVGIICLGSGTARYAERSGLAEPVLAQDNTLRSLVEAVGDYLGV